MKYHKETVKCAKCGKAIRFPASGLNHGKINKAMGPGVLMYHDGCMPERGKLFMRMAMAGRLR